MHIGEAMAVAQVVRATSLLEQLECAKVNACCKWLDAPQLIATAVEALQMNTALYALSLSFHIKYGTRHNYDELSLMRLRQLFNPCTRQYMLDGVGNLYTSFE